MIDSYNTTEKINATRARLRELEPILANLDNEVAAQRELIEKLGQQIKSRDWVLTGRRPPDSESHAQAEQARSQFYTKRIEEERRLRGLESERGPIFKERDELLGNLARLTRAAVTPESLQAEIERLEADLKKTCSQRADLEYPLARAQANSQAADDAEQAELNASAALTAGLADGFLAADADRAQHDARIGRMQTDRAIAAELAGAARAARARIALAMEKAESELATFDAGVAEQRRAIAAKHAQLARLLAVQAYETAVAGVHAAVGQMYLADREQGKGLAKALRYKGLVSFSDGRHATPRWLNSAFNGYGHLTSPEQLLNSGAAM